MTLRHRNQFNVTTALACFTFLLSGACLPVLAQVQERALPTVAQVGAAVMPLKIAPVSAPFAMPQFARPTFPDLRMDVAPVESGTLATRAIQSAIDEVSAKKGGTVVIPKGIWNTGRLVLKSNVNLHVSEGAELHFSGRVEDYQPAVFTRAEGVEVFSLGALIYANGKLDLDVSGELSKNIHFTNCTPKVGR